MLGIRSLLGITGFFICLMIMYLTPYGIKGIRIFDPDFKLFDMQFSYKPSDLHHSFQHLTEAGRGAYVHFLYLDFIFILCFLSVMLTITNNTFQIPLFKHLLKAFALSRAAFDVLENISLIILLRTFPYSNSSLSHLCSLFTSLKFISLFLWIGGLAVFFLLGNK